MQLRDVAPVHLEAPPSNINPGAAEKVVAEVPFNNAPPPSAATARCGAHPIAAKFLRVLVGNHLVLSLLSPC